MTHSPDIPFSVRRFVEERIEGIQQLETLIFLKQEPSRFWNATAVAQAVHLTERQAADCLESLAGKGLLDVRLRAGVAYRFSPATPDMVRKVRQLGEAYSQNRRAVLTFLASRRR